MISLPAPPRIVAIVLGFILSVCAARAEWRITDSIALDAVVIDLVKDPHRPFLYGLNRIDSKVLFIDLESKSITSLYVGKLPTSMAISWDGSKLYVANRGIGSGTPAGYQISVIDLNTRTLSHQFLTSFQPVNLVCGANDRLYYNDGSWEDGNIHNYSGYTGIVDLTKETEIGSIGGFRIKSHMVVNDTGTKLYGQYVYDGNLGEMGVFDVENPSVFKLDRHPYSPYPYGWDYNNYAISADGNRLAYGHVLFNADNLLIQYGVFSELVHALNHDGSIAFGTDSIWDTTTFAETGEAKRLMYHGLSASVMDFDEAGGSLFVFTQNDFSIKRLESSEVPPASEIDASLSKHGSQGFIGDGIINQTGVGQSLRTAVRIGRSRLLYARVKNDSLVADRFLFKGPAANKLFGIRYFDDRGKDISNAVVTGAYATASLSNGGSATICMMLSPRRASVVDRKSTLRLSFQSLADERLKDVVTATVRTKAPEISGH